jgi:hypothetical protein
MGGGSRFTEGEAIMEKEEYYPATCCVCHQEFMAAKSILHEMGMHEHGHGRCKCGAFLNLRFIPEENRMETRLWEDFMEAKRGE